MTLDASLQKAHGAYYTPDHVADFLARWAVRNPTDVVLDPSAGAGVFLFSANIVLNELGPISTGQIIGIELLSETYEQTQSDLNASGVNAKLVHANFFQIEQTQLGLVDAVIGNPPFIRYQQFSGDVRSLALARSREAGVELSALTSSWAPFLVHAVQFLKVGGRLAVVAPAELVHANYARPVLRHLCDSFRRVSILAFDKRVFADLSEDTVLVLAEGKGAEHEKFTLSKVSDTRHLAAAFKSEITLSVPDMSSGAIRMIEYFLPERVRDLYRAIRRNESIQRLGDFANVGIGYVTGANDFFHLSAASAKALQIPDRCLAPVVRSGADLRGLYFTKRDWQVAANRGTANYLLRISAPFTKLPSSVRKYIARGRRDGIHSRYKCRTRECWYEVPHVHNADGFLTYMSGGAPRLVADKAGAFAPNTLHVVRMRTGGSVATRDLAAMWHSSVTALSCEIEGHSLGGGLLKLEPKEAQNVLVPAIQVQSGFTAELDRLIRQSNLETASSLVDEKVSSATGLSLAELGLLRQGATLLRERRQNR